MALVEDWMNGAEMIVADEESRIWAVYGVGLYAESGTRLD